MGKRDELGHKCPAHGCDANVPFHMLMCRTHWYRVPKLLRDRLWQAWDDGRGEGTADHRRAMEECIEAVNRRLRNAGQPPPSQGLYSGDRDAD